MNNVETLESPIVTGGKVSIEKKISSRVTIKGYRRYFRIDTKRFFNQDPCFFLLECEQSGYRFYYPFNLSGDSRFYADLEKKKWYYMPWKWEHEKIKDRIKPGMKLLEVGAGRGDFLKKIKTDLQIEAIGLELNKHAAEQACKAGVTVISESVQDHAINNFEKYDMVCSFQVLEHISEVKFFLQANIDCLKKNGTLIVSVPNNDSFIKDDPIPFLNMPPHHMGLWNEKSLSSLPNYFPVKVDRIYIEPFQDYHLQYYHRIKILNKLRANQILAFLYFKSGIAKIYEKQIYNETKNIPGHSILAVYKKI